MRRSLLGNLLDTHLINRESRGLLQIEKRCLVVVSNDNLHLKDKVCFVAIEELVS